MVILVTGANGQLGQTLQSIAEKYSDIEFVFCDSKKLDITDYDNVNAVFDEFIPNYCINAAAYTAVDKAESESDKAYAINVLGSQNLAKVCKMNNTVLLHVSTDFVFDGTKTTPYTELDEPNPTGVYGQTKLDGEDAIRELWEKHFIIRTSWVYSKFGNNFMKTMLRLASEREELSVVNDQIGTPTNAVDLAEGLIKICTTYNLQPTTQNLFGIYNFSNEGQCSWFDFAQKIFEINNITIDLHPIPTTSYPTPAERPAYSVLDKSKIKKTFGIQINDWETSLRNI
ncbi:dTDP-4-dehydrorhamnose reductase [uncultured Flavobacterium sp.]|uniref:dTDP-4-dehydrorhamnose reductase n=1 Tax=uncultured Flavobacterium sp. TaxID=165435 RepID=UPI0030C7DAC8